ncbi:MAG TPA: hypothetical protein VK029_06975 [Pseudogracilibacillus sp.]|nr:hypothetical protein [Pseudogracilibacillus sp.]
MQIDVKFYLYQIAFVLVIWIGMTFFRSEIFGVGTFIYYAVTSWLLFLIVLGVKQFFRDRREKEETNEK